MNVAGAPLWHVWSQLPMISHSRYYRRFIDLSVEVEPLICLTLPITVRKHKMVSSSSFQRTLVQQLQGDSKYVKPALMCGMFKSVHPAKNDPQLLRVRLKQAASCIARLSREKQQLIALGNRLRAQIAADGRQGRVTHPSLHTPVQHSRVAVLGGCSPAQFTGSINEFKDKLRRWQYKIKLDLHSHTFPLKNSRMVCRYELWGLFTLLL